MTIAEIQDWTGTETPEIGISIVARWFNDIAELQSAGFAPEELLLVSASTIKD